MLVDADYDRKNNGPDNAHGQACVEDDLPRFGRKHVEESDANECQERLDDERRRADGHALLVRWRYPVIARPAVSGELLPFPLQGPVSAPRNKPPLKSSNPQ